MENRTKIITFLTAIYLLTSPTHVSAAAPIGYLEKANSSQIIGWAKDSDYAGPVGIHIYIDGQAVKALSADQNRVDVGSHVFGWVPVIGAGNHVVRAYAIGVDATGKPNGENPELSGSPMTITQPIEYPLTSANGKVKVVFNSKFGGAITKIYDYANMGNLNLVDDAQAGAMFQTAFWILPRHATLPPGCADRNDMKLSNPTQAGFVQDGLAGNPIGVLGTTATPDPQEFIRYEDNNQTIHFKNRFIRYDYCQAGGATMDKRQWWDTDFYLEQWASFRSDLPDTLKLRSILTYTGNGSKQITTRQMPVIFARYLPLVAYWKNGVEKIDQFSNGVSGVETPSFNPDKNWAALIASTTKKVGIGMVSAPSMTAMLNKNKFMFGEFPDGAFKTNTLFFGSGVLDMRNTGIVKNVDYDAPSGHLFTFSSGSSFEWTVYYPIGSLSTIKQSAETLLSDPANFGLTTALIPSDQNNQQEYTCKRCSTTNGCELTQFTSLTVACTQPAPGTTVNRTTDCSCPTISGGNNDRCTASCISTPIPTPTLPGDLNSDGHVNLYDYNILVTGFGTKYTIYDYNNLVANYGK